MLGHTSWDPALRACKHCVKEGLKCIRLVVIFVAWDCESVNKGAMKLIEMLIEDGAMHVLLLNLRPLPDIAHVGKCFWDGLCNWPLKLEGVRCCMQFLRTLREDSQLRLAAVLPLFPLTARDQQAPENLLMCSKPDVVQIVKQAKTVVHQLIPEKYRNWEGNSRQLQHPIAIAASGKNFAFLEADTGTISIARWHTPADVKKSSQCSETAHGLALVGSILVVTVPAGESTIQYLEVKPGGSELNPSSLSVGDLRKELEKRDSDPAGLLKPDMVKALRQLLKDERDARFGVDGGDEKEQKESRAKRPRLRPLPITGAKLARPLGIAAHPSDMRVAIFDGETRRIALVDLAVDGIQLKGSARFLGQQISATAELSSLAWDADRDRILGADSAPDGGIVSLRCDTKLVTKLVSNGQVNIGGGVRLPIKPFGICISNGRVVYTDATERTVRELQLGDAGSVSLLHIAGSAAAGFRDGAATTAAFVQPMGLAADGSSLLVCDAGNGTVRLISPLEPLVNFLEQLRALFETFGIHLKGEPARKFSLEQGIERVADIAQYMQAAVDRIKAELETKKNVNGPEGAVSAETMHSLHLVERSLRSLDDLLQRIKDGHESDEDYGQAVALKALGTLLLERFFAQIRAGEPMPTVLRYCQLKMPAMVELFKQLTACPFFYPTQRRQFYPNPDVALPYSALQMPKKKTTAKGKMFKPALTVEQKKKLAEYVRMYFKAAPQNTVRAFCRFKAGTLPLTTFGHPVPLIAQPMDLVERSESLAANGGLPIVERKGEGKEGDGKEAKGVDTLVYVAVLPGCEPKKLQDEDLFIVRVESKYFDNKIFNPLSGRWYVPTYDEPQVFRYVVLHRPVRALAIYLCCL